MWPVGVVVRRLFQAPIPVRLQVRSMAVTKKRDPYPEGWPRLSRHGWPFARWLKQQEKEKYMSKQAKARMWGTNKGADAVTRKVLLKHTPTAVQQTQH